MKGDFSRNTFDRSRGYSRVLMQQGRVQLDADWNEQGSIFAESIRQLAADLIGPHGGPDPNGFLVTIDLAQATSPQITPGRYYVAGLPCELSKKVTYNKQPNRPELEWDKETQSGKPVLLYLDVWERHVTYLVDPLLREVALGGPDTATRAQIVWQARALVKDDDEKLAPLWANLRDGSITDAPERAKEILLRQLGRPAVPMLSAQARRADKDEDPCLASPEARYRGEENQLYRVEIHAAGEGQAATFKWDSDNGSRVFSIVAEVEVDRTDKTFIVELANLGRDARTGLAPGDFVELIDDLDELEGKPGLLAKVTATAPVRREVTLAPIEASSKDIKLKNNPLLRKWSGAGLTVKEGSFVDLDKGVQIQFGASGKVKNQYRTGDYWLIPARAATGDVEWPRRRNEETEKDEAEPRPPRGIEHYLAPMAFIEPDSTGKLTAVKDLRLLFKPLTAR